MMEHLVEPLESRCLLSGVTLITHGWKGHLWGFVDAAATAITKRLGGPAEAPQYILKLTPPSDEITWLTPTLTHVAGTGTPQTSTSGEIIVKLDWTAVDSDPRYSLAFIAGFVSDYFQNATVDGVRLAELPIHEISLSRGTGMNDEIARHLGRAGIWVDQITSLDPKPLIIAGDTPPTIYDNVAFEDNYWRTDGQTDITKYSNGVPVNGAYNSNVYWIDDNWGGWAMAHIVPAGYYVGTIDLTATNGGEGPIYPAWYNLPPDRPARDQTGFIYSSIVGGERPLSGVWAASGGTGTRTATGMNGVQWPNVTDLKATTGNAVFAGQSFQVSYLRGDRDSSSTITFYLDTDRNPYNNAFAANVGSLNLGSSGGPVNGTATLSTAGVAQGRYWIVAKIADGTGKVRYAYSAVNSPLTVLGVDGSGGLNGQYFGNSNLINPKVSRIDSGVNFNWGQGVPDPSVGSDNFSVRWTGQVRPQFNETYTFYALTDDGVRLWVNGQQLIDKWQSQGGQEWSGTISLVAGQKYDIKMEYYEGSWDANAKLSWSSASQAKQVIPAASLYPAPADGTGLTALYYNNADFTGIAARPVDWTINADFGSLGPRPGMQADDWSVRWSGLFTPTESGLTQFYTEAAGGVRLWVNNTLVVNDPQGSSALVNSRSGAINLAAGQAVPIRMEFSHQNGPASIRLFYSSPSVGKRIVDNARLTPDMVAPAAPGNLRVITQTSGSVTIAWDQASDNVHVQAYNVYVQSQPNGAWVKAGSTTGTTWTQSGLSGGGQYRFRVCAFDAYNTLSNPSAELATTQPALSINGLSALYYDNPNFTGIISRPLDGAIDHNWGNGSPWPGVQPTDWSVRWSGFFTAVDSGVTQFYTEAAGGVRLWINDTLVISDAGAAGFTKNQGAINLMAGQAVPIRVEFSHQSGPASMKLLYSSASVSKRAVERLRFTPDMDAPAAPANLRVTGKTGTSATVAWDPTSDNVHVQGYNIYMQTVPNTAWVKVGATTGTTWTQAGLATGAQYRFRIRGFDAYNLIGGASNEVLVIPANSSPGLLGEYFDNADLTNLKLTRTDSNVNFDWGNGSPDALIGTDSFSVRWTGRVRAQYSETHTFYTTTDDGVRLWVNGVRLINKWNGQAPTEWSGSIALQAGQEYDIEMDYFEDTWGASAKLMWSSTSTPKQIIPTSQLFTPSSRSAYVAIEAEKHDAASGVQKNTEDISSLDNGDWVKFSSIDFQTGLRSLSARLAAPAANSGGTIEFRADSTSGPLIGSLLVQTTGDYATFSDQQVDVGNSGITGIRDLYLIFRNKNAMAALDSIQFSKTYLKKIMPLGDSITQGRSDSPGYRWYLWQSLQNGGYAVDFVGSMTRAFNSPYEPPNYDFDQQNEGHNGYTSAQVLANISSWAGAAGPDVVLMHLGTNDVRGGVGASATINNLGQIIDRLRIVNPNVTVLLAKIIPSVGYESQTQSLNALIPGLVNSKNTAQSRVALVDQYTGFDATTDTIDTIHPNSSGDAKIADKWYSALRSIL